ncbi:MAG: PPOX class F420-dependent oxidoreductase [Ktedonobacterales bacterium]|nr:PPOX class F420-dependent oxidoreductase [Ktedonobacterales bacterium]
MSASVGLPWYAPVARSRHIALTTYRKTGVAVTTQVWFAKDGDRLYMYTLLSSGKVKRLRHTSQVTLAPCTMRGVVTGPTITATARFVTERREVRRASLGIWRKYHGTMLAVQLLNTMQRWFRRKSATTLYISLEARPSEVQHDESTRQDAQAWDITPANLGDGHRPR